MFASSRNSILFTLAWLLGDHLAGPAFSLSVVRPGAQRSASQGWVQSQAPALVDSSEDAHWWGGFGGANQLSYQVEALGIFEGSLVAGGRFLFAGSTRVNCIATWNGDGWDSMGQGLEHGACPGLLCYPKVFALLPYGQELIAGGHFIRAGGKRATYIASWDGAEWHPLGAGVDSTVLALAEYQGELIVGGSFVSVGGQPMRHVARWDGSSWHSLGPGLNETVRALAVYDGRLVAGGAFTFAGSTPLSHIAAWDGTEWHPLGDGSRVMPLCFTVFDGALIADGEFTDPTTSELFWLGRWDGTSWTRMPGSATGLTVYRGKLVRGNSGLGSHIWRWNGSDWQPLGSGTNESVHALCATETSLFVGGYFTMAGGKPSQYVARWDDVITPVLVEDLAATPAGEAIDVTWRLSSEARSELRTVHVQRSDDPRGPYADRTAAPLLPEPEMSFTDLDVTPGRAYWYRLRLVDTAGEEFVVGPVEVVLSAAPSLTILYPLMDPGGGRPIPIRYHLAGTGAQANLEIFSVTGRLVRVLDHGPTTPGEHLVSWDRRSDAGTSVAREAYLVRLATARRSLTRKLVLLHR